MSSCGSHVAEFVEIESGKRAKRPQLDAALATCKKHKAKLVVAKLDRLSRNVSFLLKLIDSGVEVLFADLPELNGAMWKVHAHYDGERSQA